MSYLEENLGAADVELSAEEVERIAEAVPAAARRSLRPAGDADRQPLGHGSGRRRASPRLGGRASTSRDLGGLPAAGEPAHSRAARSCARDSLSRLTAAGWQALLDHGVRTVIDLRNAREREEAPDAAPRPAEVADRPRRARRRRGHGLLDPDPGDPGVRDAALLPGAPDAKAAARGGRRRRRSRTRARAVSRSTASAAATARASSRWSCSALLGVPAAEIAADYELSAGRLTGLWAALGRARPGTRARRVPGGARDERGRDHRDDARRRLTCRRRSLPAGSARRRTSTALRARAHAAVLRRLSNRPSRS